LATSRSILTCLMRMVMNCGFTKVFMGFKRNSSPSDVLNPVKRSTLSDNDDSENGFHYALSAARIAKSIVIIPGYGMALAQAQFLVLRLAHRLEELGKTVRFAIHPAAGRTPGHMSMLLTEAGLDAWKVVEMEAINPEFSNTNLALIVGACDVVNPAAVLQEGTSLSGMPILLAHEADLVVICNRDEKPGYSGVKNPLYDMAKTITLFGDARESLGRLLEFLY